MGRRKLSLPFSGAKLRARRERAGLLQADLAEKASAAGYPVSRTTVTHLENDEDRRPLPPVLAALAAALECEIGDLLDEGED